MPSRPVQGWFYLLLFFIFPVISIAQPGASVSNLKKPQKYEKRILASEKSDQGKFSPIKRASQNLNTRYNFFFNSERKLNEILANARSQYMDNYGLILPFYDFSLDNTADQKNELDSILWRCNDAILLHDLRNDWVDDLYLMMGKAYFYKKDFDSALIAFQYVNFAFQPRTKEEMGYNKVIGSNANESGNVYTISTKEKKNVLNKTLGHTGVRNESVIWLLRTLIEKDKFNEASSLIATLRLDANFPSRLKTDFYEMQALLFYRQAIDDSAAHYLELALDNSVDGQQRARWEYLLAQLNENVHNNKTADAWYGKAIVHTTDPILEAYARINQIRLLTGEDENKRIDNSIAELMKLLKRDKYEDYKHIIYFGAAKMELLRNNYDQAIAYLEESAKYATLSPSFRTTTYLTLGELAFETGRYKKSAAAYDSINVSDPSITDPDHIMQRKQLLGEMMKYYETIRIEDSLLRIAAMPEAQRDAYVKSLVKKLRKEQGLKEEEAIAANNAPAGTSSVLKNEIPADLFEGNGTTNGKTDWYFYNTSMKAQGSRQFRNTFGNRPNVDNWRRIKAVNNMATGATPQIPDQDAIMADLLAGKAKPTDLTVEALSANIPLTEAQVKASNDSIAFSYIQLAKILREKIGDCQGLIKNNEELINRYPQSVYVEEAVFGLYYCYNKTGQADKAKFYKEYMARNMSQSKYLRMINEPQAVDRENKHLNTVATAKYDQVYTKFIEGDFENALKEKKKADSLYGENYWTPQLLYIESVYHIKQHSDSTAISILQKLKSLYPGTLMAAKADNMINVLKRRTEIESYLTNLDIKRAEEETVTVIDEPSKPKATEPVVIVKPKSAEQVNKDVTKAPEVQSDKKTIKPAIDSSKFTAPKMETKAMGYTFNPVDQHVVVLLLNKVDVVYVNEARIAINRFNKDRYSGKNLESANYVLDNDRKFIIISSFNGVPEAKEYTDLARTSAASEIFPWMPRDKYSFFLISAANLETLKTKKDVNEYLDLLSKNISVK
jgi:outer membrane protein assembly factor BamD (BamD/ComL family)